MVKNAKVGLLNGEYEVADQVVRVTDIIKQADKLIRACLVWTEGLENEWDASISTLHPSKKFHSITLYPASLYENTEKLDEECSDGYFSELRDIYTIELSIFDLIGLGEKELMKKLQKMDRVYSASIFGNYDSDLCSKIKWDEDTEMYSMMVEDTLCKFNQDGQMIASWVCDDKGKPMVSTKQEFEPYQYKLIHELICKWIVDGVSV